jgi:hypothetical protein
MDNETIPKNFRTVVSDFAIDLSATFPEYSYYWAKWVDPEVSDDALTILFAHCAKVYPERFFDILYQNNDIFDEKSEVDVYFLPNVSFKLLFHCEGVSEQTKKTIWKYLQLMLFTVVGSVKDKSNFGDTMNMFNGIDEKELQNKLNETMGSVTDFFKNMENANAETDSKSSTSNTGDEPSPEQFKEGFKNMFENMPGSFGKTEGMPNVENLQEHLKTLFEGKIGSLAKEMAEEIADDFKDILGTDTSDMNSTNDVIKKLMKNPAKIMELMKTVGGKLDAKMKSGEFSREDMMKEAGDLLGKMKEMGGQDQFNEMFKNLAKNMGGMGKNMRFDQNAFDRMSKQSSTQERLRKKMELRKQELELQKEQKAKYSLNSTAPNNLVFSLDGAEKQEKSFIHPDLINEMQEQDKLDKTNSGQAKKKKNKKKK